MGPIKIEEIHLEINKSNKKALKAGARYKKKRKKKRRKQSSPTHKSKYCRVKLEL